jgi:hypothetical protein
MLTVKYRFPPNLDTSYSAGSQTKEINVHNYRKPTCLSTSIFFQNTYHFTMIIALVYDF